jgi:hypothetical protein
MPKKAKAEADPSLQSGLFSRFAETNAVGLSSEFQGDGRNSAVAPSKAVCV